MRCLRERSLWLASRKSADPDFPRIVTHENASAKSNVFQRNHTNPTAVARTGRRGASPHLAQKGPSIRATHPATVWRIMPVSPTEETEKASLFLTQAGRTTKTCGCISGLELFRKGWEHDMQRYLASSEFIDWHHPNVSAKAAELAHGCRDKLQVAKHCFEFVRDEIQHSWDFQTTPVTCRASDVLHHRTGYCYSKSHLLAAILRANGIPTGLCYQRLAVGELGPPYCLHALNAAFFEDHGWYRMDARGNKTGIQAEFTPPSELIAFPITGDGEADLPEIWPEPLPIVVETLLQCRTNQDVYKNLPDIQLLTAAK
jgi:transglutaminase-like putative cysteine protease